ncbi:hypothetical protein H5410_021704 [Solanum commersonii]|uniref:Uncharacterized protein n=1 Tax=Solanum commersonii TaxID=4109 RepID=A0A9J5ZEQ1_SOLCO|nr:hypothetical protein H5410_021704 [Solanum commersonii]
MTTAREVLRGLAFELPQSGSSNLVTGKCTTRATTLNLIQEDEKKKKKAQGLEAKTNNVRKEEDEENGKKGKQACKKRAFV